MSGLKFTLPNVTSFLPDNLSVLKNIYSGLIMCIKSSWEGFQIIFHLCCFFYLTFPVLCISESCTEIKIKLDFYFHFFVVPQKVL